jgi:hypothetical protein
MCDNIPKVFESSRVKARREHKCCECGTAIATGDIYERDSGLWDDGYETFKTCIACADLRQEIFARSDEDCWMYGYLRDDVDCPQSPLAKEFVLRYEATRLAKVEV